MRTSEPVERAIERGRALRRRLFRARAAARRPRPLPGNVVLRRARLETEVIRARRRRQLHYRPAPWHVIAVFGGAILLGTLLLSLPAASEARTWTSGWDALFTSTSAICVTGLTRFDTAEHWSGFGELVILALIQLGGLGIMLSASLLFLALGRALDVQAWLGYGSTLPSGATTSAVQVLRRVAVFAVGVELVVFLLLLPWWAAEDGLSRGTWRAFFHAISAFNNAGFDVMGGGLSFIELRGDPYPLLVLAAASFLGSISFLVAADLLRRPRHWQVETRLILVGTGALLAFGTLVFTIAEAPGGRDLEDLSAFEKAVNGLFLSVMGRTTGMSSIDFASARDLTAVAALGLMFVGGVAGSTAGGIKVGTFMILLAAMTAALRGRTRVHTFGREIPSTAVTRAMTVTLIFVGMLALGVWVLELTDNLPFLPTVFAVLSALCTVGWDMGVSPLLSTGGVIAFVALMFVGRLAPLLIAVTIEGRDPERFRYPRASIRVG